MPVFIIGIKTSCSGVCYSIQARKILLYNALAPNGARALCTIFCGPIQSNKRPSMRFLFPNHQQEVNSIKSQCIKLLTNHYKTITHVLARCNSRSLFLQKPNSTKLWRNLATRLMFLLMFLERVSYYLVIIYPIDDAGITS